MMETQLQEANAPAKVGPKLQRPAPNGHALPVGRPKGTPNKVTRTIREAVEKAARDCHPQGLAGWLVERANGSLGDRQIFAAMVAKALPLQVNANVSGGITISMPWLGQRGVAGATVAQLDTQRAQVIDSTDVSYIEHRINDASDQAEAGQKPSRKNPRVGGHGRENPTPTPPSSRGRGVAGERVPPATSSISKNTPSR